jgi:hypothetical protein
VRRLAVGILVVIMTTAPGIPRAHGRALARLETGDSSLDRCCHIFWLSSEGVTSVPLKQAGRGADCRLVLVYIGSGSSRPAVCIVVIRSRPLTERLCGHGPAWVSRQRRQPGCAHKCRQEPAWVHRGRRMLENIRYLLGW